MSWSVRVGRVWRVEEEWKVEKKGRGYEGWGGIGLFYRPQGKGEEEIFRGSTVFSGIKCAVAF